ncbi:MAG TPA: hypothetical protein GX697_02805, partial [Firmicutes bacterium]|nr:hypothetical protein [Bacillota bacterium]
MTGKIKIAIMLILVLSLLLVSFTAHANAAGEADYDLEDYTSEMMRGVVLAVKTVEPAPDLDFVHAEQEAEVKFTTGSLKGETRAINNVLFGHPLYDIELVKGQELYFIAEYDKG